MVLKSASGASKFYVSIYSCALAGTLYRIALVDGIIAWRGRDASNGGFDNSCKGRLNAARLTWH